MLIQKCLKIRQNLLKKNNFHNSINIMILKMFKIKQMIMMKMKMKMKILKMKMKNKKKKMIMIIKMIKNHKIYNKISNKILKKLIEMIIIIQFRLKNFLVNLQKMKTAKKKIIEIFKIIEQLIK